VADESTNDKPGPFDVHTIRRLVGLMSQHDLNEIDLRHGDCRIRLLRGARLAGTVALAPPAGAAPVQPAALPAAPAALPATPSAPARLLVDIKSPTIGTFYAQEKEGAPPYVSKGSRVTPTTVVCLVEAMKIFNEIQAGCSGVIAEILVDNKQPVEYDQVLFRVDPTG